MRLFPPSEEQYFKNDVISSEVQYPIDHLSLIDDNVTNTWMPLMGPRLGHVPTMQDWDILRQKFSHTMMEPSYRHDVPSEEQFTPMISSSASATDAHDFTTPSFSDKRSDASPSTSPTSLKPMEFGYRNAEGFLVCSYQGCTSRAVFSRGCDLRKHYKRHNKSHFCRFEGCPQSYEGGFSSKKDLARHEASHNPEIRCEWEGCRRVFSRVDNMVSISRLYYEI